MATVSSSSLFISASGVKVVPSLLIPETEMSIAPPKELETSPTTPPSSPESLSSPSSTCTTPTTPPSSPESLSSPSSTCTTPTSQIEREAVLIPSKCFRPKTKNGSISLHQKASELSIELMKSLVPDKVLQEKSCKKSRSQTIHLYKKDGTRLRHIKIEEWLRKKGVNRRDRSQVLSLVLVELTDPKFASQIETLRRSKTQLIKKQSQTMKERLIPTSPSAQKISFQEGEKLPVLNKEHFFLIHGYVTAVPQAHNIFKCITKDTYKDFLHSIKVFDLFIDRLPPSERRKAVRTFKNTTHELRELCLQASQGSLTTVEAFTKSIRPENYQEKIWDYAMEECNYIPERQQVHAQLATVAAIDALSLSRRLRKKTPTTYILRGNTAVGKTHVAKMSEQFRKSSDEVEVTGSLNPDTTKVRLIKHFVDSPTSLSIGGMTSSQTHVEGCLIDEAISKEIRVKGHKVSVILDQRFSDPKLVRQVLEVSHKKRRFVIIDIDAPLILSALRVLLRRVTKDQCVPFPVIADGYKKTKQHRKDVIESAKQSPNVDYELWVTDPQGRFGKAAKKEKDDFEVCDLDLFEFATSVDKVDEEIGSVGSTIIQSSITHPYQSLGLKVDDGVPYEGHTIMDALNQHAKQEAVKNASPGKPKF